MTANAFEEDVREAMRAGMNAHFSKPIDLDALEALLSKYLSGESGKKNGRRNKFPAPVLFKETILPVPYKNIKINLRCRKT